MANNYLQFSEAIGHLSIEEHDWLERQLQTVYVFGDHEYGENDLPGTLSTQDASWCGCRALRDLPDAEGGADADFQHEFLENEELGRHLWIFAEEGGDPNQIAHFVQKFLRRFRPCESWSLTYATTCSKLRLSEFGGGARFVTAAGIESFDTGDFLTSLQSAFSA